MGNSIQNTTLYRYFNSEGQLLYVGITKNQFHRLQAHSKMAEWFPHVATATFQHFDSRPLALKAETHAIGTELPKFNKAGPTLTPSDLEHLLRTMRGDILDEWHVTTANIMFETMAEVNKFSNANEITKLGFAFSRRFEWANDGEDRIVDCAQCKQVVESKWFQYIEYESESIIDEYRGE